MQNENLKFKTAIFIILAFCFSLFLSVKTARADLIMPAQIVNAPITFIAELSINLLVELFFGYLLFFRNNIKDLKAVVIANLISYPLIFFYLIYEIGGLPSFINGNFEATTAFLLIVVKTEIPVIILEMFIIKKFVKDVISYERAFIISLVLNLLSLATGFVFMIILQILGSVSSSSIQF